MATRGRAEQAHAFDERGMARAVSAIKRVEAMGEAGSTHRRRWPQGDDGGGGEFVKRGKLADDIAAKQLTPAVLVEGETADLVDADDVSKGGTLTPGVNFYAVNYHDTALEKGVKVTCVPWKGDLWQIIQADCVAVDNTLPPPPCPPGEEPMCPPNQEPCCVAGTWSCCDLPPPPPDPECGPIDIVCPPGTQPCCVNGSWTCCPTNPGECDPLEENCPPDFAAICVNGVWECVPTGA